MNLLMGNSIASRFQPELISWLVTSSSTCLGLNTEVNGSPGIIVLSDDWQVRVTLGGWENPAFGPPAESNSSLLMQCVVKLWHLVPHGIVIDANLHSFKVGFDIFMEDKVIKDYLHQGLYALNTRYWESWAGEYCCVPVLLMRFPYAFCHHVSRMLD